MSQKTVAIAKEGYDNLVTLRNLAPRLPDIPAFRHIHAAYSETESELVTQYLPEEYHDLAYSIGFDKMGRLTMSIYDSVADSSILIVVDEDQKAS